MLADVTKNVLLFFLKPSLLGVKDLSFHYLNIQVNCISITPH